MRRSAAGLSGAFAILAMAGAASAADQYHLIDVDIAGSVVQVWGPHGGQVMVRTTSDTAMGAADDHYLLTVSGGAIDIDHMGIVVLRDRDLPGRLPQSLPAQGDGILAEVWLSDATDRYGHAVLGDRLEAAAVTVRLSDGRMERLEAGADAVVEDLVPRLSDLDGDGVDEIVLVKSYLDRGAALAVIGLNSAGRLEILDETPPIGRSNRWLNPVGAADFDGDGRNEIAYVETPHIGGRLMIWEWQDGVLRRQDSLTGFSNHAIGSSELALSAIADLNGDGLMDMAVPNQRRDRLLLLHMADGVLEELAAIDLPSRVETAIVPLDGTLIVGLADGRLLAVRRSEN